MGIESIQDFVGTPHITTFQYDNRGVMTDVNPNHQLKLSQAIAYTVHLQTAAGPTASMTSWTKALFDVCRRGHYAAYVAQQAAIASAVVPAANPYATQSKEKFELDTFIKTPKPITDYTILKNEEFWYTFKLDLERTSRNHHFYRLLSSPHENITDFQATLTPRSLDFELFGYQCNHLCVVFKTVLQTIKGRDIQRKNNDDPIVIWYQLCNHYKGSDAVLEAAGKLILQIFQLNPVKFKSTCEFLTAYDVLIINYDNTNSDKMPNSMKLIFLKLCIRHCPKFYIAYSNWLTSKRNTKLVSGALWVPMYDEFYSMLRDAALLLDQGSTSLNRRANLSHSFDDPYDDTYDDSDDIDDLRSFMVQRL